MLTPFLLLLAPDDVSHPSQPKAYSSLGKFFVVPMLFGLGGALGWGGWISAAEGEREAIGILVVAGYALWWGWRVFRARA